MTFFFYVECVEANSEIQSALIKKHNKPVKYVVCMYGCLEEVIL